MFKNGLLILGLLFFHYSAQAASDPMWIHWNVDEGPTIIIKDKLPNDQRASDFAFDMDSSYMGPGYYNDESYDKDIAIDCKKNDNEEDRCFFILKPSPEVIYDKVAGEVTVESKTDNTFRFRNPIRKHFPINLQYENSCDEIFQLFIDKDVFRLKAKKGRAGCWPKSGF